MKKIHYYILPLLLCFALGALASLLQTDSLREWYPNLIKPALTPPAIVFPHSVEPSLLLHRHIGRTGTLDLLAQTACGHASMVSAVGAQLSVEHPVLHAPQSVAGAHRHRSTRRTGHSLHHFRNARTPFGSVDHGPLLLLDPLCDLSEPLHSSSQLNAAVGHGIIPNGRIPVYFSSSFVRILHGLRDNLLIIINYGQQQSLRSGSGQNPRQSAGCERHCEKT